MVRSNRFTDGLFAAVGAGALITGLAAIDGGVREHVTNLLTGDHGGDLAALGSRAHDLTRAVLHNASFYRAEHGPLVFFGLAALVLTVVMFKS